MRVLAFEDTYDLTAMLDAAGCNLSGVELVQRWNSDDPLKHIMEFKPDVVMLDFFHATIHWPRSTSDAQHGRAQQATLTPEPHYRHFERSGSKQSPRKGGRGCLHHQIRYSHSGPVEDKNMKFESDEAKFLLSL